MAAPSCANEAMRVNPAQHVFCSGMRLCVCSLSFTGRTSCEETFDFWESPILQLTMPGKMPTHQWDSRKVKGSACRRISTRVKT